MGVFWGIIPIGDAGRLALPFLRRTGESSASVDGSNDALPRSSRVRPEGGGRGDGEGGGEGVEGDWGSGGGCWTAGGMPGGGITPRFAGGA